MALTQASPIYHRIAERLRSDLAAGRFCEGDRMPSETELAREYSTTRGTVRQALQRLEFEGLIVRSVGRGTFAAGRKVESRIDTRFARSFEGQMEAQGAKVVLEPILFELALAPEVIAQALGLRPGEPAHHLKRRRLVDDQVVGYEDRWLLGEIGRRVRPAAVRTQSAMTMVEAALGEPLGNIEVLVRATAANAGSARLLATRRGSPLLVRAHTFFDRGGRPVLTGQSVYRADRYQFTYVLEPAAQRARAAVVP